MAIRIPILTSFDPKGLKQANASFANLQSSVGSLGRNFAGLGVALAGAGALITKNVQSLARIETINAQTAQTISSMGNAANISAVEVEGLAGKLESLTAIEAESIQEGANLLLTFGNIRNELGAGNDIFTQTTGIMVDMGVALKKGPVDTATMLGKALNDPIRGITALRKVGVSFTEQQLDQVKALQNTGDLMGAQKLILEELQKQYGGSGEAYAKTFTGQLELMGHELGTIGEEATMAVMPALQMMVEELRELIPIIGPQLKAAIESVDWKGLITSVVDFTRFLVENAENIAKSVAALWALSTIVKTVNVLFTLGKVAADLYAWGMAQVAAKTGLATVAVHLLRAAMILLPLAVLATAFAVGVNGAINLTRELDANRRAAESLNPQLQATAYSAEYAGGKFGYVAGAFSNAGREARILRDDLLRLTTATATSTVALITRAEVEARLAGRAGRMVSAPTGSAFSFAMPDFSSLLSSSNAASSGITNSFNDLISAQNQAANSEQQVIDTRVSAFQSFNNSVKQIFGQIKDSILSSFNLPTLGNSINSITRNIGKLLEKTRSFAQNISKLAGLGLNPALLQQVIGAGPMAGSQLAAALVGGGSAFVSQLNSAYGEFGNLASGIAGAGVTSAFNNPTVANTYNIEVNGGVGSGPTIGKAIVDAIKSYERTSGAVWQGA